MGLVRFFVVDDFKEADIRVLYRNWIQDQLMACAFNKVYKLDTATVPNECEGVIKVWALNHVNSHAKVGGVHASNLSCLGRAKQSTAFVSLNNDKVGTFDDSHQKGVSLEFDKVINAFLLAVCLPS